MTKKEIFLYLHSLPPPFTVLLLQCFLLCKEPFCVMQDAWSCRGVSSGWHGRLWFDECYFEPPWFESSCLQNLSVCVLCMTLYILAQVVKAILKWTMLLSSRVKSLRQDVTVRILARVQQNGGEGRDWRVRKLQLVEHKVKEDKPAVIERKTPRQKPSEVVRMQGLRQGSRQKTKGVLILSTSWGGNSSQLCLFWN